jgi:hypothetical protein
VTPSRVSRVQGVTLVELLIVFSIVGLLVSLVAPSSVNLMDKARAQEEWLVLDRTIDALSFKAYSEARNIELTAKERTLEWVVEGKPAGVLTLSHLRFDKEQLVKINPNGLADVPEISVLQADRRRSVRLNRWLDGRG